MGERKEKKQQIKRKKGPAGEVERRFVEIAQNKTAEKKEATWSAVTIAYGVYPNSLVYFWLVLWMMYLTIYAVQRPYFMATHIPLI